MMARGLKIPNLSQIQAAANRIEGHVLRTPLVTLPGHDVRLKAENLQPSGAFKLRGAFNAMLSLDRVMRERGVVAHSSGNHAMAVAYAARALGLRAVVVMPDDAPRTKLEWVRRWGADVIIVGSASDERMDRAREIAGREGLASVEPYDSVEVLAATGTIGIEILRDMPDVERVYVPVSGGGLIGGIAQYFSLAAPLVEVIGVEPEVAADAAASLAAGRLVSFTGEQMSRTIADGLRVQQLGDLNWEIVQRTVRRVVTVTEEEIQTAMRSLLFDGRLLVEPSGAVALAGAIVDGAAASSRAVAIISGGNCDPDIVAQIVNRSEPRVGQ
jgi:threonine dehydratase